MNVSKENNKYGHFAERAKIGSKGDSFRYWFLGVPHLSSPADKNYEV